MDRMRVELTTSRVQGGCSSQLSYRPGIIYRGSSISDYYIMENRDSVPNLPAPALDKMVGALGIGPRTSVLSGQRSATELRPPVSQMTLYFTK